MPFKTYEPGGAVDAGEIPLCIPHLAGNEWEYIRECLDTNMVSSVGSFVTRFEAACAARAGARFGVAAVTGTAALHTALVTAGVGAGDAVLVSTLTFIAPVNAIRYVGAVPIFIDAEATYWEMDPRAVARFLEEECTRVDGRLVERASGRRVVAIMPVHILGHPVDMDPILELARHYDLVVIEDATESLGASYRGRPVGAIGRAGCFSFNGNKLVTTGGGGMLVTNDETLAKRAKYLTTQAKDDPIEFVHGAIGFNYRLTNIAAALGVAQLEQVDAFIARKREIARRYDEALGKIPGLAPQPEAPWAESVHWLYTMLVDPAEFGMDSRALLRILADAGIQSRPLWQPAHRSPAHADLPQRACPVADELNRRALSLPSSVGLTDDDQERVIAVIRSAAGRAGSA